MTKRDDTPKTGRKWTRAGSGAPGVTRVAGNIMALVAYAMLFDDGVGEVIDQASGAATLADVGDRQDPES